MWADSGRWVGTGVFPYTGRPRTTCDRKGATCDKGQEAWIAQRAPVEPGPGQEREP